MEVVSIACRGLWIAGRMLFLADRKQEISWQAAVESPVFVFFFCLKFCMVNGHPANAPLCFS